jgi:hypothetical protein
MLALKVLFFGLLNQAAVQEAAVTTYGSALLVSITMNHKQD